MRINVWLVALLCGMSLVGCENMYRLDARQINDPILIVPGTRGAPGGPIWVSLPEFSLESTDPLQLSICLQDLGCLADTGCDKNPKCVSITLEENNWGLEAHIPPLTYDALARTPHPEEVLYEALKSEDKKFRILQGQDTLAAKALAVTLAARLPRNTSNTWSDLYAYDPVLRSLALVPGMRLRLEGMLPVTADAERPVATRSQGSITAPSYIYLSPADDGASGPITLSPALRGLDVSGSNKCKNCPRWTDAGGLSSLIEQSWRYWAAVYPKHLGPVRGKSGDLQFVHEDLNPTLGPPAVLLIAAAESADMAKFLKAAKDRITDKNAVESFEFAQEHWLESIEILDRKASENGFTIEKLTSIPKGPDRDRLPKEVLDALEYQKKAFDEFQSKAEEVAVDCKLVNPPTVGCYVLRYRVLPVPEILVTVQGVQRWVEIGTTIGMVLAANEPLRAPRTLAGVYEEDVEKWRNAGTHLNICTLDVLRLYQGRLYTIEVQPEEPADAIRNVILQPGDEIKWSN